MKNIPALFLLPLIAALLLGGCNAGNAQGRPENDGKRLKVVTTLFPYYDFVRQVAGDKVDLKLVLPAGMDSHSFEPTPADMRMIQDADVLIRNGGAMEHWLDEALCALDTRGMTVVTMLDFVDTLREEQVEGMEEEHGHDHAGHKSYVDYDGHEVEIEYDEHIWTSPVGAMKLVEAIRDTLTQADPENARAYRAGAESFLKELADIDAGFREVCAERRRNMIIVADKFPFRYLAEEYGLDYRAAFSGCSTDTEPSAKTIAYLIDKVKEKNIPAVYYLELSSHRVAQIIGEETGVKPLLLHSCHNVTRAQFDSGITYAALMRQNIENLRKGIAE